MTFFTALWAALNVAIEGAGDALSSAASKVSALIWNGTSITVIGCIVLASTGISLIVLVFNLITNFVRKLGGGGGDD